MTQRAWRVARTLVRVAIGIGTAWFVMDQWPSLRALWIQRPFALVGAGLMGLLFMLGNGLYNLFFFEAFGIRLTFREWCGLSVSNTLGNLVTPFRGGTVDNALYLKDRHALALTKFTAALTATYVVVFLLNGAAGMAVMLLRPEWLQGTGALVFGLLGAVVLLLGGWILAFPRVEARLTTLPGIAGPLATGWARIQGQPGLLVRVGLVTLVNLASASAMLVFELRALGAEFAWHGALLITVFASFSLMIAVTPAGLGVREAFAAASATLAGIPVPVVVTAVVIDRFVLLASAGVLLPFVLSVHRGKLRD